MLNNDALAQLRQLKQTIHDSKDRGEGSVKGSQGRFGFVTLDDGRDIYLPPEQMQRVFPGDRVAIEVVAGNEGKPCAQLERLIESPLRTFTGRYVVRDNAHFVEPDPARLNRWIFVPPKLRRAGKQGDSGKGATPAHGDYVRARIAQHPFRDGKAQARIDAVIGGESDRNIEARYALARFDLPDAAPPLRTGDLAQPDAAARRDLTALPLVTIDGADTRDMDDALYAEPATAANGAAGWKLIVAIADPGAWIKPGSALETTIAARATSAYFPGFSVPMLPEELANERCSLLPGAERLALVCEIALDAAGAIERYEFCEARVRSHAKLSYEQAADYLRAPDTLPADATWPASLQALHAAGLCLQRQRQRACIVLPERTEFRAQLDAAGRVAGYQRQLKTVAHQLVEECMIATNICAARFLADGGAVFIGHGGFRSERRENVNKLIAAELPQLAAADITTLPGYIALMHGVASTAQDALPLREILLRSHERSCFSAAATPHFGMGLERYVTITSPIRKFNDYLSQRAIKAKLRGAPAPVIDAETIAQLQDRSDRTRQAANFAQQWLDSDYLAREEKAAAQPQRARRGIVVHVTSSGVLVRLLENGIQGFLDTRQLGEKFSFDAVYQRLSSAQRSFQLDQEIDVTIAAIDHRKRQIAFAPTADATAAAAG